MSIKEDSQYNNIIAQNLIVSECIMVRLYGLITQSLNMKKGVIAYLHGKLNGKLINEVGTFYVFTASCEIETYNKDWFIWVALMCLQLLLN